MQINITQFFNDAAPMDYSASRMELGDDAGPITWNAAKDDVADYGPLLSTPEQLQAMREFAHASGGWDVVEIATWDDVELNALFIQWVAGDIRETPDMEPETWDWDAYNEMGQAGIVASRLYLQDGAIYFDLES